MKPPRDARSHRPSPRPSGDLLEGRNPVLECLTRNRRQVRRILLDQGARPVDKVLKILDLARSRGIPVQPASRPELDALSVSGVHNGVIAFADPLPEISLRTCLESLDALGVDPFIVLVDEPQYEQNVGAILRTALGTGVHALVIPTARGKGLTPVVQRVAMGAAEEVPLIREGISSCLALLQRRAVRIVGADMDGVPPWTVDLRGPLALVLGGEDKGLTDPIRKRCDAIVGIPLQGGLASLNLSVSAGALLVERVRQVRGST